MRVLQVDKGHRVERDSVGRMNDFVTFYYPPDRQGETLYLELALASGSSHAVFYSAGALQASLQLKSNRFEDAESYQRAISRAAELIGRQGGLMVEWSGGRCRLSLWAAQGYRPPSSMLLLSLFGPPRKAAIESGQERARDASQRMVMAVSQEAEHHLEALLGQLSGFPDDIQSVIFNSLRRPALESRLSRLEGRLAKIAPGRAGAAASSRKEAPPALLQPWVLAPALVSLVFLFILVGIYWANRGISGFSPVPFLSASCEDPSEQMQPEEKMPGPNQPSGPQAATGAANQGPPGSPAGTGATSQPPPTPEPAPLLSLPDPGLRAPLGELLAGWAECGADTPCGKLYESHLASLLAEHPGDLDGVLKQESAAWGLAKLIGLAAGMTLPEDSLNRADHRSALKSRLHNAGVPAELQAAFAYFGCLAFAQPGLKEYPGDSVAQAYLLESADCRSIDRLAALAAVDQLSSFVRTRSGPQSQ